MIFHHLHPLSQIDDHAILPGFPFFLSTQRGGLLVKPLTPFSPFNWSFFSISFLLFWPCRWCDDALYVLSLSLSFSLSPPSPLNVKTGCFSSYTNFKKPLKVLISWLPNNSLCKSKLNICGFFASHCCKTLILSHAPLTKLYYTSSVGFLHIFPLSLAHSVFPPTFFSSVVQFSFMGKRELVFIWDDAFLRPPFKIGFSDPWQVGWGGGRREPAIIN